MKLKKSAAQLTPLQKTAKTLAIKSYLAENLYSSSF